MTDLPAALRTTIRSLTRAEMTDGFARLCLDLPKRLAEALDRHVIVAIDEFQELISLSRADVLPIIRSTWQQHRRVGYVVSGSGLRWRRPGGTVVPMTVIGDAAEREVATLLAHMGFDLVYQSRASRGAFDLLATRGASQLGIQVKRSALPLSFSRAEWQRMSADAKRLGWRWAIASIDPAGTTLFLDPAKARRGKTMRLGKPAVIESLVAWLDA